MEFIDYFCVCNEFFNSEIKGGCGKSGHGQRLKKICVPFGPPISVNNVASAIVIMSCKLPMSFFFYIANNQRIATGSFHQY